MIAPWMLFALVTGGALTVAASAAERVAVAARRPRRFVWMGTLVATALWPLATVLFPLLTGAFPTRDGASTARAIHRLPTIAVASLPGSPLARHLDVALLAAWAVASAVLLVRLAAGGLAVRRWRRAWPAADVDGVRVRVSPDAGPAVVGLHPMDVVLPAWALALDPAPRALVLRHEAEHRAARDPYVLLAAALTTALAPWHLALWWQARALRLAVELDCDARVLRAAPHPAGYARLLLDIAQHRSAPAPRLAPALSALPSHLERRILAMHATTARTPRRRPLAFGAAALAAVAAACAVESPDRPTSPAAARAATKAAPEGEYFEFNVEQPATLLAPPSVRYPDALRTAGGGITGRVVAQFVVDTTGRVDPRTVKVLRSTHPAFTAAVQAALPLLAFRPARVGARPVKQLVQLPFEFVPPRASATGAR